MAKIKSIPEGYTIYDKTVVDIGSITVKQFFEYLTETYKIEVVLIAAGKYALYNAYLPGNKHAPRLEMKIEDVYNQVAGKDEALPDAKKYLRLEIGGSCMDEDDTDF